MCFFLDVIRMNKTKRLNNFTGIRVNYLNLLVILHAYLFIYFFNKHYDAFYLRNFLLNSNCIHYIL